MDGSKPIVAGVDGSASSLQAVRWAAAEAARRNVPLRLLMARALPRPNRFEAMLAPDAHNALLDQARQTLLDAERAATEQAEGLEVSRDLQVTAAAPALIAASHRAQLVVVGSSGLGGVAGLFIGSVALATAAHSKCPVVVVRGGDEPQRVERPIVVGVDGTSLSDPAVDFAFETAAIHDSDLLVVHVRSGRGDRSEEAREAAEESVRTAIAEQLRPWTDKYPKVAVRIAVRTGRPQPLLVELSHNAQLIVVGTRGRGALAGIALGSVGHALLHKAACPVALARSVTAPNDPEVAEGPVDR